MKNSKISLTINKEEAESNDYLYCWSELGERPNKIVFHNFFYADEFLQFLAQSESKLISVVSEFMSADELPIINDKKFVKLNDQIWISYTHFDKLGDHAVGEVVIIYGSTSLEKIDEISDEIRKFIVDDDNKDFSEKKGDRITFVELVNNGLEQHSLELSNIDVDNIDYYYNDDVITKVEKVIKNLKKNESGLTIIWGERGCGKSTLANYIATEIDKPVIFLPTNILDLTINNPDFSKSLRKWKNSVVIIDDAEIHFSELLSKNTFYSNNLLQFIDGLIYKNLGINFIVIANIQNLEHLDQSLVNCNNLVELIEVPYLSEEKSSELLTLLNKKNKIKGSNKLINLLKKNIFGNKKNEFGYK